MAENKSVTGVIILLTRVRILVVTGRGPPCRGAMGLLLLLQKAIADGNQQRVQIHSRRKYMDINSGQIIATSHDLTPNDGLVRDIPLFQANLGW